MFNLSKRANPKIGITMQGFCATAKELRVGVAEIRTVDEVESAGSGFLSASQRPKILVEGHYIYALLRPLGLAQKAAQIEPSVCYPKWTKRYYIGREGEYSRLAKATELCHRLGVSDAIALKATSWGRFQIMGENYKLAGFNSVEQFVEAMFQDEALHLAAFARYLVSTHLDDELRSHLWAKLARGYNGPGYMRNNYPAKLGAAFNRFSRVSIDCSLYAQSNLHVVQALPGERAKDPDVTGFENTSLDDRYASASEGSPESSTSEAEGASLDAGGAPTTQFDSSGEERPAGDQDIPPKDDPNLDPAQRSGKENIVIEKPVRVKLWDYLKTKLSVLTGGNLTFAGAMTQAQQVQGLGLSQTIVLVIIGLALLFSVIAVGIWVFSWWREEKSKEKNTDRLIAENSNQDNIMHFAAKEGLEDWKKWGAVVVRR